MFVQLNDAAHYAAVILKMAVPIGVRQNDIRSAVWAMLIRGVNESAKIRLNLEHVEVIPSHLLHPGVE